MTTRSDVAKLANVSESTVSYVLSGKRPISETTKKRVLAAIKQSGYKSNYAAAALAGGSSRIVTIMIAELFSPTTSAINERLVDGIVAGVQQAGLHSVIWPISGQDDSDVKQLLSSNFSGGVVLMNVSEKDRRVIFLHKHDVPFVVLGRTDVDFEYSLVDRDFDQVYATALSHLKDLGHKVIGVMQYEKSERTSLTRVATDLKLSVKVIDTVNTLQGGLDVASSFKKKFPSVTAIISLLDTATIGFVSSAKDFGISVPKDVSVVGVNILDSQAETSKPQITSVLFDAFGMGQSCGSMLAEIIAAGDSKRNFKSELWAGDLIDRGSTAANLKKSHK